MDLAEWEFGQGDEYCAHCADSCPPGECPRIANRPETPEARAVWDLAANVLRGQMRYSGGMKPIPTGYDMTAAFQAAEALAIPPAAVAIYLPAIEAGMIRAIARQAREEES